MTHTVAELLPIINSLPSLPTVVMELLHNMGQQDRGNIALARKISQDQALSLRVLKLANSSFYGSHFRSKTVEEAVNVLGSKTVYRLAAASALIHRMPHGASAAFDVRSLWRHSLGAALSASALAQAVGFPPDIAYLSGLLHDVGRLALATHAPTEYQQAIDYQAKNDCSIVEAERVILGIDHSTVGEALTRHWRLPQEIQTAVAFHHAMKDGRQDPLVMVMFTACLLYTSPSPRD